MKKVFVAAMVAAESVAIGYVLVISPAIHAGETPAVLLAAGWLLFIIVGGTAAAIHSCE